MFVNIWLIRLVSWNSPDALLKRIMLLNNEEKGEAFVAENYDKSIEELTWHLIKRAIAQE